MKHVFIINFSLGCKTTTNCIIGGSALEERKSSKFDTGKRAANEIIDAISIKSCVDEHVQVHLVSIKPIKHRS